MSDEKITIIKPQSVQEQLVGKLPLLSVEQKGGESSTITSTNESSSSSSTSSETSNSSSDSSVKKISFS